MTTAKPTTVDEYIASFPDDVQSILNQVREIIYKREPDTKEAISYGIPAFRCNNQIFIFLRPTKNTSASTLPQGRMKLLKKNCLYIKEVKAQCSFPCTNQFHLA